MTVDRAKANQETVRRIVGANPVLVGVGKAIDVVPGMEKDLILTSGAPIPWSEITGLQRHSILLGAMYEGLASTPEEAAARLDRGEIRVDATQPHGCIGAGTGVYTASMSVYVVENKAAGTRAYCNMVEGNPPRVFAYGAWGPDVLERLRFIEEVYTPVLGEAIGHSGGGIPLRPIMRRAVTMGDELHFRVDAGTVLFLAALAPYFVEVAKTRPDDVKRVIQFMQTTPVMFLRVGVSAAKCTLDAATGVEGSSIVTAMILSSKEFALRVSGLPDRWFRGPFPEYLGDYFWGSSAADVAWSGGESSLMECHGLGGLAMAASLSLQFGGPSDLRIQRNREMYDITVAENKEFPIPYFQRGAPLGIDIFKVVETGIRPYIQGGVLRKDGEGAAGVGALAAAIEPFRDAVAAWRERYGADG